MAEWRLVDDGIVPDGAPILVGGLNPWKHKWKRMDEPAIIVAHPQHPHQRHTMPVYEMSDGDLTVRFAAGEFSNTAWGFYLPSV